MRKLSFVSVLLLFFVHILNPVYAGPVVDEAARAEGLVLEKKYTDSILAMDAAMDKLWNVIPLTFVDFHFVTKRPTGYGNYEPRPNTVFKAGEDMIVYVELAGFEYRRDGKHFTSQMSIDMEIRSRDGKVLGEQKDFLKLSQRSRVPGREYFAVIIYNFATIPNGKYALRTFVTDKHADDRAWFQMEFEVQ